MPLGMVVVAYSLLCLPLAWVLALPAGWGGVGWWTVLAARFAVASTAFAVRLGRITRERWEAGA